MNELETQEQNSRLFVNFSMHPVQNKELSLKEGRPVFEDVEYIQIQAPGDRGNTVHRAVRESDKKDFAPAYRAWVANREGGGMVGTPLSQWPVITRSEVEELAFFKCHTVEQLAGMSDGNLRNVGPILELRKKAQAWVEAAKSAAPITKLQAEKDALAAQVDALQRQMADVVAKFEAKAKK